MFSNDFRILLINAKKLYQLLGNELNIFLWILYFYFVLITITYKKDER